MAESMSVTAAETMSMTMTSMSMSMTMTRMSMSMMMSNMSMTVSSMSMSVTMSSMSMTSMSMTMAGMSMSMARMSMPVTVTISIGSITIIYKVNITKVSVAIRSTMTVTSIARVPASRGTWLDVAVAIRADNERFGI